MTDRQTDRQNKEVLPATGATVPQDVRRKGADARTYEVIVKFHKSARPVVEAFLVVNMFSVIIAEPSTDEIVLAHCLFQGDIKTLDAKLAALRQSAMVILGDKEEKFLDFFVALRQLSEPLPQLIPPSRSGNILSPDLVKGFLIALGLLIIWQGYYYLPGLLSRVSPPTPAPAAAPALVSEWAPYVLPEYQQAWLDLKRKHRLSDAMMLRLFSAIKAIDKYGPGHQLRDLTLYPKAIDRALGLIILKDVTDTEALRTLHKTLEGYSAQWRSLPDNPVKQRGLSLSGDMFNDQIVLTFYEQVLEKKRRQFTEELIQELRRAHLSTP